MAKVAVLYERVSSTSSPAAASARASARSSPPASPRGSSGPPATRARTYGDALVDEVEAAEPEALIWDTTERGKPDLLRLAREAFRDFGAEAVFIVSNKPTTSASSTGSSAAASRPSGRSGTPSS